MIAVEVAGRWYLAAGEGGPPLQVFRRRGALAEIPPGRRPPTQLDLNEDGSGLIRRGAANDGLGEAQLLWTLTGCRLELRLADGTVLRYDATLTEGDRMHLTPIR